MKKTNRVLLSLLMIAFTFGVANAQFRFGPRAGININKLHLSNASGNFSSDNRCGFTGGLMAEFQVPLIGLCFDASLMYARMNSAISTTEGKSDNKDFFEVPINLKYKFGLPVVGNIVSPYLFTGPSFAFKLGGKDEIIKQKTFQWAWNIGLGVELLRHLQVGAGYAFGINSVIDKVNISEVSKDIKAKNSYWTITAAYLF